MVNALIARDRGFCWLVALLCALALGCNNATHNGDHDAELPPPRTTTRSVPADMTTMMAGSELPVSPPAVDMIPAGSRGTVRMPCISCGTSCRNCGGGCSCDPGGIPDHDEWLSPF